MKPEQAYEELIRLSHQETVLASANDLLEWDEEVVMPPKGMKHRAEQMALIAGITHDRATDPRYEELLSTVEASSLVSESESPAAVNVRELRRGYDKECRIPRRLVEESARVTALASRAWEQARKKNDYKSAAPWLDKVFTMAREEADASGHNGNRYDALLDDYEPGMTSDQLTALFAQLRDGVIPLIEAHRDKAGLPSRALRTKRFPVDLQRSFAEDIAKAVGFDFDAGCLDIGRNPFCTQIGPGDVRVVLCFYTNDLLRGIFTLLHELGHAFYDGGLDAANYGTPMGESASAAFHESQSRLWENFVGRSAGFWRYFYPRLRNTFDRGLRDVSLETFMEIINRVEPGVIRVEADEVTYNIHVLIRVELERALLSGDLVAADLPGAWSELYLRYLGVTPTDDRSGCLQDSHWAEGLIGYFPTYALGNVYSAQIFEAAGRDLGTLDDAFGQGDFDGFREWLRENIHRHGMRYRSGEIIKRITGRTSDPSGLIRSLSRRYELRPSV
ncbi:MAG: carboxypeptidase M32 [Gemmatimonadales bacterium]